jgi:Transposase DNA-binding
LGGGDLGDKRRTARLLKLGGRLSARPESAITQAGGDWAQTKAAADEHPLEWRLLTNLPIANFAQA